MGFSFDNNGNLKQSKMFLYSSKTKPIGILSGACNVKLEQNFHKLFELNFKIYKNINNEENEFYDSVIKSKLIEVQYINWFQILSAVEKYDDNSKETYKEVKCCPLENMLIYRKVDDIVGVFGLYDITDTSKSLLHIISAECGWSIGHVSNELLTKYRTFDINSMEIYNLLTTKISDSFGCVFQFDSYTKTINAYLLSELEEMTDIIISKKNILKEYIKDDSDNPIVTKMRVRGADDLDIRSVNLGRNYLVNLDYYMTEDWCSQGLVDAYNTYKTDYNNIRTSFNTSLARLKTKNAELTTLKAELKDLESLKSAQENVMGVSVQSHGRVPIPSDSDYTIYQNAVTLVNGYVAQIVTKKNQITSKQNEINSVQLTLDSISDSIDENNYFTPEQIAEMNGFIVEGDDYEDSTFVVTSETTEEEALEIKTELMQNAYEDLFIKSRPQYTFTIKATNLYTIQDDKDELIPYSEWVNQFKIGSLITLNLGSSYMTVRLMTMIIDFDNPEEIDLVFSNKSRLDDELIQLAEIIADSGRTASSLSLKKMGYDAASKQTNQVREFMNGTFKASLNSFQTNDNQEMVYDEFGLHGRKYLPDQNKYSDEQLWINNNGMLLTSDGWKTASMGLGLLTAPDGSKYYGLNTEVIVGSLLLGGKLNITNSSGTYLIDNNGFTANATVGADTYSVGINPSTPSDIINVKVNGVKQLYLDTVKKKLVYNGTLGADVIYAGKINASQITAGNISGDRISGGTITGTSINSVFYSGSDTITIGMSDVGFRINVDADGVSANAKLLHNGLTFSVDKITRATYGKDGVSIGSGFSADKDGAVTCSTINKGVPITSKNIGSQSVSYADSTGSTSYATSAGSAGSAGSLDGKVYVSSNGNLRPSSDLGGSCGTDGSQGGARWTSVWALNGVIQTSDARKKANIKPLSDDERFIKFAKLIVPYTYQMTEGASGRYHVGFIAQRIEEAMNECGISDMEFAGLIKNPIYAEMLKDEDGNELDEFDMNSKVVDYSYSLRYDEFIPLLLLKIKDLENKVSILSDKG